LHAEQLGKLTIFKVNVVHTPIRDLYQNTMASLQI